MDSFGSVGPSISRPKPLTRNEIYKMKKIMHRVPIIKKKNDEYHQKEEKEADEQFNQQLDQLIIDS